MNEEHPLNILAEQIEKQDPNKVKKPVSAPGTDNNVDKEKNYIQQPIRTFESDVARVLGQNNTSKASMVIAEKKRRDELARENLANSAINRNNIPGQVQSENNKPEKYVQPLIPLNKYAILRDETTSKVEPDASIKPDQFLNKGDIYQNQEEKIEDDSQYKQNIEQSNPEKQYIKQSIPTVNKTNESLNNTNFIPIPKKPSYLQNEQVKQININNVEKAPEIPESERVMINNSSSNNNSLIKKIILFIFGIIFLGGGLFGAYYFYSKSVIATPPPKPVAVKIPSLLPSDVQLEMKFDSLTSKEIYNKIYSNLDKQVLKNNDIVEFIPSIKNGENIEIINSESFIKRANIDMPNQLLRSLGSKIMLGGIKDVNEGNTLFIAFTTSFFQNTYAGMLSWEKDMPDELEDLMNYRSIIEEINNNASSSLNNYFGIRGRFIDKQIKNRDVREFIHESGKSLFLYTFIDKNTLIITKTENALGNIVEKIEKQNYIR